MKLDNIIKKLPEDLQKRYNSDLAKQTKWTEEWYEFAKETVYQTTLAREEGLITQEEWQCLRDSFGTKLGMKLGPGGPFIPVDSVIHF